MPDRLASPLSPAGRELAPGRAYIPRVREVSRLFTKAQGATPCRAIRLIQRAARQRAGLPDGCTQRPVHRKTTGESTLPDAGATPLPMARCARDARRRRCGDRWCVLAHKLGCWIDATGWRPVLSEDAPRGIRAARRMAGLPPHGTARDASSSSDDASWLRAAGRHDPGAAGHPRQSPVVAVCPFTTDLTRHGCGLVDTAGAKRRLGRRVARGDPELHWSGFRPDRAGRLGRLGTRRLHYAPARRVDGLSRIAERPHTRVHQHLSWNRQAARDQSLAASAVSHLNIRASSLLNCTGCARRATATWWSAASAPATSTPRWHCASGPHRAEPRRASAQGALRRRPGSAPVLFLRGARRQRARHRRSA